MQDSYDLIVLGAGAAGCFAAISAKQADAQLSVLIIDAAPKPLAKVKISGGGRCNVTHNCFDVLQLCSFYPRGGRSLAGLFSRFGPKDCIEWFASHGVELYAQPDGRMFPVSDDSQTVIDLFLGLLQRQRVEMLANAKCSAIEPHQQQEGFVVHTSRGSFAARKLLVASGGTRSGGMQPILSKLGHKLLPALPSLFTFKIKHPLLEELFGVVCNPVELELPGSKLSSSGPLLITHWGISGPATLKLSAFAAEFLAKNNYRATLKVNWLGGMKAQEWNDFVESKRRQDGKKLVGGSSPFAHMPKRFWQRFLELAKVGASCSWSQLGRAHVLALQELLFATRLEINGQSLNKDEFVSCGGVDLKQVDLKTMQSKLLPGLYFAGEVLNVDGLTGGFNFQHAWSSGFVAGNAIAAELQH